MSETKYVSVREAAEKWQLTPRRVQQFCKEGLIEGTKRSGRQWLIPEDTEKPEVEDVERMIDKPHIQSVSFMPLTASAYPLGKCKEYIQQLAEDEQALAFAEYYYFSGQADKAAAYAETYLNHNDPKKKLCACIIYGFASLSINHINAARFALNSIKETLYSLRYKKMDNFTKAACVFAASMGCVLLHLPDKHVPPLENYIQYLPNGLKLYACYILAHKEYLHKNYERAIGIADTALMWYEDTFPIPEIYLHTIAAISAMNIKHIDEAKKHFQSAWEIAKKDGMIEAIGEHHGLLQGLIETMLKTDYPEDYQQVIRITYSFSSGWRKIHNPDMNREVADDLTTTEFTIAMLADRGWSYQEIADHMKLSPNTVSKYLSSVYQRLGIRTKEELHSYMLY